RGQVVLRPANADRERRDAQVEQLRAQLVRLALDAARTLDLARVAAGVRAVLVEDLHLALHDLRVAEAVPDVAVLGDQLERLLLAAAADEHRDLACRRRVELAEPRLDARQRLREVVEAAARGA